MGISSLPQGPTNLLIALYLLAVSIAIIGAVLGSIPMRSGGAAPPLTPPPQAGHSEAFLCSVFANLTDELVGALRDAWLAMMVAQRRAMRRAEDSPHNRARGAIGRVLGLQEEDPNVR